MSGGLHRKANALKSRRFQGESPKEGDIDDDGDGDSSPSVLWEKHFEQSIFVDIGDDDSLHASDLPDSFMFRVCRGSPVSGSACSVESTGLSSSCKAEECSSKSSDSINERRSSDKARDMKFPQEKVSIQWPSATQQGRHTDDTSDDDQEELPYDGEVLCDDMHYDHLKSNNLDNLSKHTRDIETEEDAVDNLIHHMNGCQEPRQVSLPIPDVLLRHFSQVQLLKCNRPIEAETMPEVSLLDSVDETVLTRASLGMHATSGSLSMKHKICPSLQEENENDNKGENHITFEGADLKTGSIGTAVESDDHASGPGDWTNTRSVSPANSRVFCASQPESKICSVLLPSEDEKKDEKNNLELMCSGTPPIMRKVGFQGTERFLGRARSCGELKYGQGQVHYPLPDFSKVAPKVRIPKGSAPAKPICPSPLTTDRNSSVQGIFGKPLSSCTADVISRVLEDSIWLTERPGSHRDKENQSKLDQFLQAEYDKLLAKYADDDNLIKPTRIKEQVQASSELSISSHLTVDVLDIMGSKDLSKAFPQTSQPDTAGLQDKRNSVPSLSTEQQTLTDGQRLTSELTDIVTQFMEKVEEFKTCISNMSMTVEEQQMVFKSLMEAQDQLERNYRSKKEEHRALEMQNYMGLGRNTGDFDPDRQVEGQIFRLGMYLEDIKEQIDRNAHCELCPPPSSSTSIPPLHETCVFPSSLQPSLREESVLSFSTSDHRDGEDEEHFKVPDDEPKAADMLFNCSRENSLWENDCNVGADEDQHHDVPTQLTNLASPQHRTPLCRSDDNEDPRNEDPPQQCSNETQRLVMLETDSGFSNSDLSRPPTRLSDTQCNAECLSPSSPSDEIESLTSMSLLANEENNSTLHTVVSNAYWDRHTEKCGSEPDQPSSHVQNLPLNYTTQNSPAELHTTKEATLCGKEDVEVPPLQLQQTDQEEQFASSSTRRAAVDEMTSRDRHNQRQDCSCQNSEAIRALQYEVSCLKGALQESLAHLPLLNVRMESLSSIYNQAKRGRTRSRRRHQHRATSSRLTNTDLSFSGSEEWISSDMENSTSKGNSNNKSYYIQYGTDSGGSDCPEQALSSHSSYINSHSYSRPLFNRRSNNLKHSSTASLECIAVDKIQSRQSTGHQRANVGPVNHDSDSSSSPSSRASAELLIPRSRFSRSAGFRSSGEKRIKLKDRPCSLPSHSPRKPLLQVSYGSCCSLPPGLKIQDHQSDSDITSRRRSTQSDSALLPSNVYFQLTSPCPSSPRRVVEDARRHRVSKEEAINRSLDKALEAALMMKQTTDRMAKTISADLAKAQLYRKSHGLLPLSRPLTTTHLTQLPSSEALK